MVQQFLGFHGFSFDARAITRRRRSSIRACLVGVPRAASCAQMTERYFGFPALVLEPGVRTGMPILYDNPKEVGADRIANAVGAYDLYGGPSIVVDFGTATTIEAISAKGEYLGGAIFPGVEIAMDALFGRAAGLRRVELAAAEARDREVDGRVDPVGRDLRLQRARSTGSSTGSRPSSGECAVIATGGLADLDQPARPHGAALRALADALRSTDHLRTERLMEPERTRRRRRARRAARAGRGDARPGRGPVPGSLRPHAHRWRRCASTGTSASRPARRATTSCASPAGSAAAGCRASSCSSTLRDGTGELQLFVNKAELGDDAFARFVDEVDRGDWVGVEGAVMKTKKGELSVNVKTFALLAKSLRPLPEKWHGLADTDTRFRQRYVDLIANDDARRVFAIRFAAIAAMRALPRRARASSRSRRRCCTRSLGGATARPFVTHHNALDTDFYLRDRARALPQAPDRRRPRQGVRDRAGVPQRGRLDPAQSRVHDARALRGVRRLHRHDAADRAADRRAAATETIGTTVVEWDGADASTSRRRSRGAR